MRFLLYSFLLMLTATNAQGQFKFHTHFGPPTSGNEQYGRDVVEDWNGGLFVLSEEGSGSNNAPLTRINPDGTEIYNLEYLDGASTVKFNKLTIDKSDSSIVMAAGGSSAFDIQRVDSSGNIMWTTRFESMSGGSSYDVEELFVTPSGNYLLFGIIYGCSPTCSYRTIMLTIDPSGNYLSANSIQGADLSVNLFKVVQKNSNNNYILALNVYDYTTSTGSKVLAEVNESGSILNETEYIGTSGVEDLYFESIHEASNGDIYVGGVFIDLSASEDYLMLLHFDAGFNLLDGAKYQFSGEGGAIRYINETSGGNLVAMGNTFGGSFGGSDVVVMEIDPLAFSILDASFKGTLLDDDFLKGMETSDGGYLAFGSSIDNGGGVFSADMMIFKMDSQYEVGCSETTATGTQTSLNFALANSAISASTEGYLESFPTLTPSTVSLTPDYFCSAPNCNVQINATITDVDCNGNSTGAIDISVTNVSGNMTYSWTGPSGFSSGLEDIAGLEAGVYDLTLTDNTYGCVETASYTVIEPNPLTLDSTASNPSCFGVNNGSINLIVNGGSPNYTYNWNGPNSYTASTEDIAGLLEGTYNVTVNDANGCTATESFILTEPDALNVTFTENLPTCNGDCNGELTANVTGGTGGYTYVWTDGMSQTTQTATGLCSGTYSVIVEDANNCDIVSNTTLSDPPVLSVDTTVVPASCNQSDGSAEALVSGGVSPYSYSWTSGGTAALETGLASGTHTVTVTDNNGCSEVRDAVVGDTTYGVDLCVVTIDTSFDHNLVIWEKPTVTNIDSFYVYREIAGNYSKIGAVHYDSLSQFTDTASGINPTVTSYRYKVSTFDACGSESEQSDFHETIHLTVNQGTGSNMNLIWDNYEGFSFVYYKIWKNDGTGWTKIDSVSSANTTYTDPNSSQTSEYYIEVDIPTGCTATRAVSHNSTRSNKSSSIDSGNNIQEFSNTILGRVYPNPGKNQLFVEHYTNGTLTVNIYNVAGELVKQQRLNQTVKQLNVHELENGLYVIELRTEEHIQRMKWIKTE